MARRLGQAEGRRAGKTGKREGAERCKWRIARMERWDGTYQRGARLFNMCGLKHKSCRDGSALG